MRKLLILALLISLGAGGWWFFLREGEPQISYITESLKRGDLTQFVTATGTIEAVNTVSVGSQVSGNLAQVLVDYNDQVTEGQLLAVIDPTLFQADVDRARASLATAQADLAQGKASLSHSLRTLERKRELVRRNLIAKADQDDAELSYQSARATLMALEGKVSQARASLTRSETDLANTRIVSPVNGVVIAKKVETGQTVAASFSAPELFTIAEDLRHMKVETDVDEADIGTIRVGQPTSFTVDAYPSRVFKGKVDRIRLAPNVNSNVVTYTVEIGVSNDDLSLYPGMTAEVNILTARVSDVLMAPSSALRITMPGEGDNGKNGKKASNGGTVYTLSGDSPVPVKVKTGMAQDGWIEVIGDLQEGVEVVVEVISNGSSSRGGSPFGPTPGRRR